MADRTERVVLTLVDNFSGPMARVAASTEAASTALHDLDGESTRASRSQDNLNRSTTRTSQTMRRTEQDADRAGSAFRRGSADIDSYSGRLGLLARAAVGLGPALLPLTAAAVPAVTSLATGFGAAAGAVGTLMLAFHGVGDAFTALNAYQLEPTAENLTKMQQAMDKLGPSGENFVRFIDSLGSQLSSLQNSARDGIFPGFEVGIQELMTLLPQVSTIIARVSAEVGDLGASFGKSFAHDADIQRFLDYIGTDAAPTLSAFARAAGNVAAGLADMLVAFQPLTRSFTSGLLDWSRSFRNFASDSSNFQGFIDYVRQSAPQAKEFFSSLVGAVAGLAHAMAPYGSAVLPVLTSVLNIFSTIANSPIGPTLYTAAAAMALFGSAATTLGARMAGVRASFATLGASVRTIPADLATVRSAMASTSALTVAQTQQVYAASTRLKASFAALGPAARAAAGVGGMLLLSNAATRTAGGFKTLETTLAGTLTGFAIANGPGAAIGTVVGLLSTLTGSENDAQAATQQFASTLDESTGKITDATKKWALDSLSTNQLTSLEKAGVDLDQMTTALVEGGSAWTKYRAYMKNTLDLAGQEKGSFFRNDADDATVAVDKLANTVSEGQKRWKAYSDAGAGASDAINGEAGAMDSAAAASQRATASLNGFIDAQNKLHQATLQNLDAQTAYGAAIKSAEDQAKKGTKGFSAYTEAGRANRQVMSGLIGAYNQQGEGIKNNVKQYQNARDEVAKLGHQMGLTKDQIRNLQAAIDKPKKLSINAAEAQQKINAVQRLMNTYGLTKAQATALLDDNASGKIHSVQQLVDKYGLSKKTAQALLNDLASGKLHSIIGLINALHDKTVTVRLNNITENSVITHYRSDNTGDHAGADPNRTHQATGGYITGPGGPTSDSIPAMLSNGEYVVRAAAVDKYGVSMLHRINSMAYANGGLVQRFATGGHVDHVRAGSYGYGDIRPEAAADYGDRIANMSIHSIERLSRSFDDLDKRGVARLERALSHAADIEQKRVDAAKQTLAGEKQTRADLASTIRGSLTVDAFAVPEQSTTWNSASTAPAHPTRASVRAALTTERNDARKLSGYIATIRKRMGSGQKADAFISWILSQSDPVAAARIFATETAAQTRSDAALYGSATAAVKAAGVAGGAIYNNEIATQTAHLAALRATLHAMQAEVKQITAAEKRRERRQAAAEKARERRHKENLESRAKHNGNKQAAQGARDRKR